jgi:hypothetical protein
MKMGVWDVLEDVGSFVNGHYDLKKQLELRQKRYEAYQRILTGGVRDDIDALLSALDDFDTLLQGAEYAVREDYAGKIANIRDKLNSTKDSISKFLEHYDSLEEVWKFTNIVREIRRIDIMQDPQGAALAFGKAFSSIGKFLSKLPAPFSFYGEFLAGMETFFDDVRRGLDPEVHMKEPGIREVIRNL